MQHAIRFLGIIGESFVFPADLPVDHTRTRSHLSSLIDMDASPWQTTHFLLITWSQSLVTHHHLRTASSDHQNISGSTVTSHSTFPCAGKSFTLAYSKQKRSLFSEHFHLTQTKLFHTSTITSSASSPTRLPPTRAKFSHSAF